MNRLSSTATQSAIKSSVNGRMTLSATRLPVVARNDSIMPRLTVVMASEPSMDDVSTLWFLRKNLALQK